MADNVEVLNFKHDFFGKADAFKSAPRGSDPGCVSVLEYSTDLESGVEILLCWFKLNASEA